VSRVAWLDLTNGVSGDMLLGALVSAGVPLDTMTEALEPMGLPISLRCEPVDRAGLAATKVSVDWSDHDGHKRTWRFIRKLLERIDEPVRASATKAFTALAEAEAHVHGIAPEEVHFHEVGALDAIADVVASCAGLHALGVDRIVVSPIAVGGGTARTEHGTIPVPVPAVLRLLSAARAPTFGGTEDFELATPTGVAIATAFATEYGAMPPMTPEHVGIGAGSRNPAGRPNVARLVLGEAAESVAEPMAGSATVLEANIDDMDPRVWPDVLTSLLEAGAGDAWLIPIAMKKGRPAHTLCAIVGDDRIAHVRSAIFANTTTIGIRESAVVKHALARQFRNITVDGQQIAVKLGVLPDGQVINAMPEWEDVARAARLSQRPVKSVLSQAMGLAARFTTRETMQGN
jgi:pyridinium-3,5-bisthiocarboxylic acid mononucleotide nickel chelatase